MRRLGTASSLLLSDVSFPLYSLSASHRIDECDFCSIRVETLCPHLRTRRKTSSVSWERKRLDGLAVPLSRRGVPIRHIGHGWDRQRRSFNSCINKVGDRYATKLTGGFLAADLDICNADVPFKTETIVRSENANERRNGVRRREIVLRDARFEQRTRLSQRGDRVSLASLPKSGCAERAQRVHDRQHHAKRSWAVLRDDDGVNTDRTACPTDCDAQT